MSFSDRVYDSKEDRLREIGDIVREYMINYAIDQYIAATRKPELTEEDMGRYTGRLGS